MGKNPKFRPVKRCIFCPNPANSGEHGWSRWALTRLQYPGGMVGSVDGVPYRDPKQKHLTIRCTCIPCNTTWMKRLEDAVLPTIGGMMFDKPMSLNVPQQWAIAQWAIKSAMVFEHINKTADIFYSDNQRASLRAGSLPTETGVWIARADGIDTFATSGARVDGRSDVVQVDMDGLITTIAYRRFVVQVLSVRMKTRPFRGRIQIDGDGRWGDVVTPIWPPQPVVRWPVSMTIAPGAFDAFHRRFSPTPSTVKV